MKRAGIVGILLLLSFSIVGCCGSGYYGASPCGPLGCGSLLHRGVVDYVDGGPGACEANCGGYAEPGYAGAPYGGGCAPARPSCLSGCSSCLGNLVNGIFVLGEGAFCLAASPFVLVGNLISGGCAGYETFPNCGCSNEVYYGDNCLQSQDFCDPCANVANSGCGCGSGVATSSCTRCAGGYTEGIQFEGSVPKQNSGYRPLMQPARNPAVYNAQMAKQNRPIAQTGYRQQSVQQPQQRLVQPQRQTPPRPAAYDDETAYAQ